MNQNMSERKVINQFLHETRKILVTFFPNNFKMCLVMKIEILLEEKFKRG